ncbi:coadhesin-like isoform X1 [Hydra vulgaris]|uniref:Coadhesin-like isoform X1 n=1 Tax=Hydra vulgaris TaxID=6087 RepID=A0ABM4C3I5_HYDVU
MKFSVVFLFVYLLPFLKGLNAICRDWFGNICKGNGGFSEWSSYSTCSATCGNGIQQRVRTCTNPVPSSGGKDCVGERLQTQKCLLEVCKLDGGFSEWSTYSACSATCGDGNQQRVRTCTNPVPSPGGKDCVGKRLQTQKCFLKACPVDGGFSEWSTYSACLATCGDGIEQRVRTCTNPVPSAGGKDCVGERSQTKKCNLKACPVDGGLSEWSAYSACSATCGDANKSRVRTCTNPIPSGGGNDCVGELSETVKCYLDQCIVSGSGFVFDLKWSSLKKEVCLHAKDDLPAQVPINQNGVLVGIKIVYLNGRLKCHDSFTGSNFGCFNDQRYFNLAVTDNKRLVLFPSQSLNYLYIDGSKNYQYPGFLPTDNEVIFVNYNYPTYFKIGDYIAVWNYEDLLNYYEGDNSGRMCVDVYGAFA